MRRRWQCMKLLRRIFRGEFYKVWRISMVVKFESFGVYKIKMFYTEEREKCSTATGFLYKYNYAYYFVTNWHNITGRHPHSYTLKPHKGIPQTIEISFRLAKDGKATTAEHLHKIDLYNEDDQPNWLEHPLGSLVDVVCLHLNFDEEAITRLFINPINNNKYFAETLCGSDAFVLGYPEGISGNYLLPVFKRGSIATEIDFAFGLYKDTKELPCFLIDIVASQGMSGAPVITYAPYFANSYNSRKEADSIYLKPYEEPNFTNEMIQLLHKNTPLKREYEFLGCFSGILARKNIGACLGIVWKEQAIIDIIEHNTKGNKHSRDYIENKDRDAQSNTYNYYVWEDEEI